MMHGYNWNPNQLCGFSAGYFSIWHLLMMVGIVIIAVAVLLMMIRRKKHDDPLESLKLLYVKGDISEEAYMERKSVIERK